MNAYLTRFNEWFAQLAPRERWMVAGGSVVVIITLLYLAVWEPLAKAQLRRSEALDAAHAMASRLEELSSLMQGAQAGGGAVNRSVSILSAVDQSARSGSLEKPPSRIQPEGDKEVKVWVEDVSFDGLTRWMHELETRYGVRAQTAEIEKQAAPGVVSARLSLVR
ncbi:MAG TPA: type II secretion system protein M [Solimonas sp.]|nr:type II secretion system protein M [Solimonas sp.]